MPLLKQMIVLIFGLFLLLIILEMYMIFVKREGHIKMEKKLRSKNIVINIAMKKEEV